MGGGGQDNIIDPPSKNYPQPSVDPVDPPSGDPVDPIDPPAVDPVDPPESDVIEITSYTPKTYEDYFTDFKVPTAIEDTTVTGTGSESDPYIINSTEDFLYLFSTNLREKNLKLNCDIILNDETFDENGQPSGGDGYYYSWTPYFYDNNPNIAINSIDGNGHTIKGVYMNDPEAVDNQNFTRTVVRKVKNLNFQNVYLSGNKLVSLFNGVYNLQNCKVKSGTIRGTRDVYALAYYGCKEITNCENRANIIATSSYVAGLAGLPSQGCIVKNCANYGNVQGLRYTAGLISQVNKDVVFENCINYGKIESLGASAGGIAGETIIIDNRSVQFKRCKNYGDVISSAPTTTGVVAMAGGMISMTEGVVDIKDCVNDALISTHNNVKAGELIGYALNYYVSTPTSITIQNAVVNSQQGNALIGDLNGKTRDTTNLVINISKCRINYENTVNKTIKAIIYSQQNVTLTLNVTNIVVNLNRSSYNLGLMNQYTIRSDSKVNVKNVMINCLSDTVGTFSLTKLEEYNFNGIIVAQQAGATFNNLYYGTNFRDFYASWQTGRIGLNTKDAVGSFQGVVNEEVLQNKGYAKLT